MSVISINTGGLTQNAGDLSRQLSELRQMNKRLETMIATIESSWGGAASQAYVGMMRRYMSRGKQMEQVLQEFIRYANQAVERFRTIDRDSANKIYRSF